MDPELHFGGFILDACVGMGGGVIKKMIDAETDVFPRAALHNEIVREAPRGASVMYAVCCVTAPRTFLSFFSPFFFFS